MQKTEDSRHPQHDGVAGNWVLRLERAVEPLRRFRILMIIVTLCLLGFAGNALRRANRPHHHSEFAGFRDIVQVAVVQGRDHYHTIDHIRGYPPFFAIAFAPFGLPPYVVGAVLFILGSIGAIVWASWLCAVASGKPRPRRGRAFLLALITAGFTLSTVARCESDMLVLLPVAGALYLLSRDGAKRHAWAGALLGFAAMVKLTPGLFGVYLLVQRRWAALTGMVLASILLVAGLGTLVWGPEGNLTLHRSWVDKVLLPMGAEGPTAIIRRPYRGANQSPTAALFRYLNAKHRGRLHLFKLHLRVNVADVEPKVLLTLSNAIRLVVLAILLAAWFRAARTRAPAPTTAAFGAAVIGMLLCSPVSLHTHHCLLMIPYAAVLSALTGEDRTSHPRLVHALLIVSLVFMCLTGIDAGKELSTLVVTDLALLVALLLIVFGACEQRSAGAPAKRSENLTEK